jgi:hypothetical protein
MRCLCPLARQGFTPLMRAAELAQPGMVAALLAAGATPTVLHPASGWTALHRALMSTNGVVPAGSSGRSGALLANAAKGSFVGAGPPVAALAVGSVGKFGSASSAAMAGGGGSREPREPQTEEQREVSARAVRCAQVRCGGAGRNKARGMGMLWGSGWYGLGLTLCVMVLHRLSVDAVCCCRCSWMP